MDSTSDGGIVVCLALVICARDSSDDCSVVTGVSEMDPSGLDPPSAVSGNAGPFLVASLSLELVSFSSSGIEAKFVKNSFSRVWAITTMSSPALLNI